MSISSSIRNLSRGALLANYPAKDFLTSAKKWRSYTGGRSPHLFIETRNPKTSRSSYIPSPPSRSFSTSSNESNSTSKTGFIGWYLRKLESRPIATKTVTTSVIYAAADLTAQMISSASGSFDLIRTLRMAGYGLLILGPSQHLWFNFMSKILPKRDIVTTFKKMFMGQALYGPANYIIFFSYNAGLQGESGNEILARLKRDLLPTLRTGLLFWPMCDFATFRFVPVHLQPLTQIRRGSGNTSQIFLPMEWWANVRRVLNTVAFRFGFRKRGLLKLRSDIRACEYNDVQVMWEMLRRNEAQKAKKGSFWNCFGWARSSPYLGRSL